MCSRGIITLHRHPRHMGEGDARRLGAALLRACSAIAISADRGPGRVVLFTLPGGQAAAASH